MKDDLLEGFGCLRKDMKENEELREIIAKVRRAKSQEPLSSLKLILLVTLFPFLVIIVVRR